jgi:hypothetical protein
VLVVGGLTLFTQPLNTAVFLKKEIKTEKDKYELVRMLGISLSLFLFGLSAAVMSLRVVTGKSTPASNNDPLHISTINRIISNTIEQSIIFAGLFGPLLFSSNDLSKIGGDRILALASLFVLGRLFFTIGYAIGSFTSISTFRSFGFCVNMFVSGLMVTYHLGINLFPHIDTHLAPLVSKLM